MTKKIYILGFLIIASLFLDAYLTKDFYGVQYGTAAGDSICSINDTFNCEAVAASKYSNLIGVPNSILGFMLHLIMLIGLFGILINSDNKEAFKKWVSFTGTLAIFNVLASVVMGAIALFAMNVYCIFCIALYILSALILFVFHISFKENCAFDFPELVKNKTFLSLLIAIPALGMLGHSIIKNEYSPKALQKEILSSVKSWKGKPTKTFEGVQPLFVVNKGGSVKITEFADFLCPHCSTASKTLKSFLKNHKDVELSFYAYPLDPNCNKNFPSENKGPGFSCTLAQAVLCAEKQGKGRALHDHIFNNQLEYRNTAIKDNNDGLIKKMEEALGANSLDFESWKTCLKSEDSQNIMIKSAKLGKEVDVQGTPTIYMEGRKLNGGANFLILKAAYDAAK